MILNLYGDYMIYVSNAFSFQMISEPKYQLDIEEISKDSFDEVKDKALSSVGHEETANILGVKFNRIDISLKKEDILYVAQLTGGRLPEGATKLPEGFSFKFLKVELL